MTEDKDVAAPQEEEVKSHMLDRFRSARESAMNEAAELSEIYRSIKNPNVKDVYSAWVKNMDVVANSYSWGREKPGVRTVIMKGLNRIVGIGAAGFTGPIDLAVNILTWPPRQVPGLRHFIPKDIFKRHTIRMAEQAKHEGIAFRVGTKVISKAADAVGYGVAKALDATLRGPIGPRYSATGRSMVEYGRRKIHALKEAILHPKSGAA